MINAGVKIEVNGESIASEKLWKHFVKIYYPDFNQNGTTTPPVKGDFIVDQAGKVWIIDYVDLGQSVSADNRFLVHVVIVRDSFGNRLTPSNSLDGLIDIVGVEGEENYSTINIVDGASNGVIAGSELTSFNNSELILTVYIQDGVSTNQQIADAISTDSHIISATPVSGGESNPWILGTNTDTCILRPAIDDPDIVPDLGGTSQGLICSPREAGPPASWNPTFVTDSVYRAAHAYVVDALKPGSGWEILYGNSPNPNLDDLTEIANAINNEPDFHVRIRGVSDPNDLDPGLDSIADLGNQINDLWNALGGTGGNNSSIDVTSINKKLNVTPITTDVVFDENDLFTVRIVDTSVNELTITLPDPVEVPEVVAQSTIGSAGQFTITAAPGLGASGNNIKIKITSTPGITAGNEEVVSTTKSVTIKVSPNDDSTTTKIVTLISSVTDLIGSCVDNSGGTVWNTISEGDNFEAILGIDGTAVVFGVDGTPPLTKGDTIVFYAGSNWGDKNFYLNPGANKKMLAQANGDIIAVDFGGRCAVIYSGNTDYGWIVHH